MVLGGSFRTRVRLIDVALWLLAAGFAFSTAYFSFGATPAAAESFPGADKVGHLLAYFLTVFTLLLAAVWRPARGLGAWPAGRFPIAFTAIAVGAGIEVVQGVTDRGPELLDWIAEVVGVALSVGLHVALQARFREPIVAVGKRPVS